MLTLDLFTHNFFAAIVKLCLEPLRVCGNVVDDSRESSEMGQQLSEMNAAFTVFKMLV